MDFTINTLRSDSGQNVYIYKNNSLEIPLNSLYSPEKEADRFINKFKEKKNNFFVFIGFGNGSLIEKLVESDVYEQNIQFLFIEPFKDIKISDSHKTLFENNSDKLSFLYIEEFSSLVFAQYLSKHIGVPVTIQLHPNYQKISEPLIRNCLKILNEGIETKQILNNTEMKFAVDWIVEPLLNIQSIAKSINISQLKGKFAGEKAILIAAGPTLQEHIKLIKDHQNSFHLFAVGSALRALLENDIDPDYVLSLDAGLVNYESHFEGLNYSSTLIYETMSNSKIQDNHKGPLIVAKTSTDYVTSEYSSDLYSFPKSSPSVAILALQVIAYFGFSEVYLVGQDLALVNDEYYASGVKHHDGSRNIQKELMVESNTGGLVGTTRALKIFLDSFEALIKTLPEGMKVFNLSKQGAKIQGAEYISSFLNTEFNKKSVERTESVVLGNKDPQLFIREMLQKLSLVLDEIKKARKQLKRYLDTGVVSAEDMQKAVKGFRKVAKHDILEYIILSRMTFRFNKIMNKFKYMENKERYMNEDLLTMTKELDGFYNLVLVYIEEILKDNRLTSYK